MDVNPIKPLIIVRVFFIVRGEPAKDRDLTTGRK
jgi:hypothetical protein